MRFYERRNEPSDFIRGGESCLVSVELSTYWGLYFVVFYEIILLL